MSELRNNGQSSPTQDHGPLHAKLYALGQILAGYSESDFARAAAGSDGENILSFVTGLCFNAADEIERLQHVVSLLTPPCGMGITIGSCPYPSEPSSPRDMPCCLARRALRDGGSVEFLEGMRAKFGDQDGAIGRDIEAAKARDLLSGAGE